MQNAFPEQIQNSIQFDRHKGLNVHIYKGDLTEHYPELLETNIEAITLVEVIEHFPENMV
jgi:hypothetical protein